MRLVKDTPFEVAWQVWKALPGTPCLTVVVKATFTVAESGPCSITPEQTLLTGDRYIDDDPSRTVAVESDFAYVKPRGECLVAGCCRAPWGAPSTAEPAGFRVGPAVKGVAIIGDRLLTAPGSLPTDPAPFSSMPLCWERSFGGSGTENPVGLGLGPSLVEGRAALRLPNIEDPDHLIGSPGDRPRPTCVAPIPRAWPARRSLSGTFDDRWRRRRWPWLPLDFRWDYFNAAPEDQRIDGFFRGDEEVVLVNLHPNFPRVQCHLPRLRVRVFLRREGQSVLAPLSSALDTVTIDADAGTVLCLWRAVTELPPEGLAEVNDLFVIHEGLESQHSAQEYRQWFERCCACLEEEDRAFEAEPVPAGVEPLGAAQVGAWTFASERAGVSALPDPIPLDSPVMIETAARIQGPKATWIKQFLAVCDSAPPRSPEVAGDDYQLEPPLSFDAFIEGLSGVEAEALDIDEPPTIMLTEGKGRALAAASTRTRRQTTLAAAPWALPAETLADLLEGLRFLVSPQEGTHEPTGWSARSSSDLSGEGQRSHPTFRFLDRIDARREELMAAHKKGRRTEPPPEPADDDLDVGTVMFARDGSGDDTIVLDGPGSHPLLDPAAAGAQPPMINRREPSPMPVQASGGDTMILLNPTALPVARPGRAALNPTTTAPGAPNLRGPLPGSSMGGQMSGGDTMVLLNPLTPPTKGGLMGLPPGGRASGGDTMMLLNPLEQTSGGASSDRPSNVRVSYPAAGPMDDEWDDEGELMPEDTLMLSDGESPPSEERTLLGDKPSIQRPDSGAPSWAERLVDRSASEDITSMSSQSPGDDDLGELVLPAWVDELIDEPMTNEALVEGALMAPFEDMSQPTAAQLEERERVLAAIASGEGCAGWDLTEARLAGLDLRGADFRGALLTRADLRQARFDGARLDGAVLLEADLTNATFCETSLSEAFLTRVRGQGVRFEDALLEGAVAIEADLSLARFVTCRCAGVALSRAALTGAIFERVDLNDADLSEAQLDGAIFLGSSLRDANLGGASARQVSMTDCDLTSIRAFDGADFSHAVFTGSRSPGGRFQEATLDSADLTSVDLDGADFSDASLIRAKLRGCLLRGARLDRARLVGAILTASDLQLARLEGADLRVADLMSCNLYNAEFLEADLEGARLTGAIRTGTKLAR